MDVSDLKALIPTQNLLPVVICMEMEPRCGDRVWAWAAAPRSWWIWLGLKAGNPIYTSGRNRFSIGKANTYTGTELLPVAKALCVCVPQEGAVPLG